MRRVRIVVATVPLVVTALAVPPAVADPATAAAPTPQQWTNVTTPPMSGDASDKIYNDVAIIPGGGVWATGYTRHQLPGVLEERTLVERNTGAGWTTVDTPDVETAPASDYLYGVSGTAANDVWVVGQSATAPGNQRTIPYAIHWNGTSWTRTPVPDPSGGTGAGMQGVVAISRNNVWAVGTTYPLEAMGAAYHWDGRSWSSVRLGLLPGCKGTNYTELTGITATPNGDVYAAGDCPTASGYAGFIARMSSLSSWQVVARIAGRSSIADITSDADGTVWATGNQATDTTASRPFLLYGSGTTWAKKFRPAAAAGSSEQAHSLAVTPTGITVVGELNVGNQRAPWGATWNGTRWLPLTIAAPASTTWIAQIAGSASGPVWAMGQYIGVVGGTVKIIGFASYPN